MVTYPGKVLLFGEYTILRGSRALAMPFPHFSARWVDQGAGEGDTLLAFANYLGRQFTPEELEAERFWKDITLGLRLESDIPIGYGLGSSGSVCVAVFDRYAGPRARALPEAGLKAFFGRMESHFHGSSSGADPLIVYLDRPVLLQPDGHFTPVELPPQDDQLHWFLLDTRRPRRTGPLVQQFLQRVEAEPGFDHAVRERWIPATEAAIDATLAADTGALLAAFRAISALQQEQLTAFIPAALQPVWQHAAHALKLCGAGGGGYMLGLSTDWPHTQALLAGWHVLEVSW